MSPKFETEVAGIAEGAAAIESADATWVKQAFHELEEATNADVGFSPEEVNELFRTNVTSEDFERLKEGGEHLIDTAQSLALPLATVLIMWAGFKKMFEGFRQKKKSR